MSRVITIRGFNRIRLIRRVTILLIVLLLCRLYMIQLVQGEELHLYAMKQQAASQEFRDAYPDASKPT